MGNVRINRRTFVVIINIVNMVHCNLRDMDVQDAGTSLDRVAFKTRFDN